MPEQVQCRWACSRSPGDTMLPLDSIAERTLEASSTLAVSLEPAGGSPTGSPTGPHRPARAFAWLTLSSTDDVGVSLRHPSSRSTAFPARLS